MIPSVWIGIVLALASFRLTRLVSYDDFPPVARLRSWVIGAQVIRRGHHNARMGVSNDEVTQEWVYARPLLTHFLGCVYCVGFWISCTVYAAWVAVGSPGAIAAHSILFYPIVPFALSAATGIIARRLDP